MYAAASNPDLQRCLRCLTCPTCPPTSTGWYIADKDQLNVNEGDLYRVSTRVGDDHDRYASAPPPTGWSLALDGRHPLPTFEFHYTGEATPAQAPAPPS